MTEFASRVPGIVVGVISFRRVIGCVAGLRRRRGCRRAVQHAAGIYVTPHSQLCILTACLYRFVAAVGKKYNTKT